MPVTSQTLVLEQRLRDQLAAVTDAQERDLVAAWVLAWDEVAPDLTAALQPLLDSGVRLTRAQMLRASRLRQVLAMIAIQLEDLAAAAGVRITGDLAEVVDAAGRAQASLVASQMPSEVDLVDLEAWPRARLPEVEAIVRRSTEQITSRLRPLSDQAYDAVRRELVRGVAAGSNPRVSARRMVQRAEGGFNGGLTRALVIARTETLDAHRAAASVGQAQHTEVLAGWYWLAALTPRTCRSCLAQHGTLHDLDEPGPLDHQQGRCARMPAVRPWSELGLDVEEPPSLVPDAAEFFAGLDRDDQVKILGPRGYAAWKAGRFPMSDWSQLRTSGGWRDSYGPAIPPAAPGSRGGRRAA